LQESYRNLAYAKSIEQYRVEAPDAADDQSLGPRTALFQTGKTYSADGREIRNWDTHVQREMRRLAAQDDAQDAAEQEAQRWIDGEDDPTLAEAVAVAQEKERLAVQKQIADLQIADRHRDAGRRGSKRDRRRDTRQPRRSYQGEFERTQ
jgi:hypothetical protein